MTIDGEEMIMGTDAEFMDRVLDLGNELRWIAGISADDLTEPARQMLADLLTVRASYDGNLRTAAAADRQEQLDAAKKAFRDELSALVVGTWRAASPPVYYQVGIGRIRDAIDEPYRIVQRNFNGERHDWPVIEKIIKHCGGNVDHFRDLFVAAGWEIHDDD